MVTAYKITERAMGYRGSKSILNFILFFTLFILFLILNNVDTSIKDVYYLIALNPILTYFEADQDKLNPILTYFDADQDKLDILQDNKSKSGIYRWVHKATGRSYVGSSVNLTNRFYTYYNLKVMLKSSSSSIIARSLLKYGYSGFKLEIIEYCEPDKCLEREQYYLDSIQPELNILKNSTSRLGVNHSETTIEKK